VVTRGEVWWVEDPAAGRRPHLVVTRDAAIPVLNNVLAVPATTSIRGIPTEVVLSREDGMPRDCVLSLDNLTSLPKAYFVEPICTLGPERMTSVCKALDHATGCR
jgi:mRNA interferase MazF